MEKIEKRAKAYATRLNQTTDEIWVDDYEYDAYIQGATEQHKIDVDKACEWLDEVLCSESINSGMDKNRLLEAFRKAMEG